MRTLVPFIEGSLDEDNLRVGARSDESGYVGPIAEVSADLERGWLDIITDHYEGTARLNIETLPALQEALNMVAERVKRSAA